MVDNQFRGLLEVYFGKGKGKTTAAVGMTVRMAGHGKKVLFLQFFKKNLTGELIALQSVPGVLYIQFGTGDFLIHREPGTEDRKEFILGWELTRQALVSGEYDLVVLDELLYAFSYGFLSWEEFKRAMEAKRSFVEVIVTGRNAPQELIAYADLVSEIMMVKHPLQKGIQAREGIEY